MDQERIGMKVIDAYKVTGELLLKAIYQLIEEHTMHSQLKQENKTFTSEANWNHFLETKETKHFETFLNSEVNTEKLKQYLNQYEVGFAMKENKDSTNTIAIDAKNVQVLQNAFKAVINDLTNPEKAEKTTKELTKSPQNMALKEKLTYYKQQTAKALADKAKSKVTKKIKTKEEKGL